MKGKENGRKKNLLIRFFFLTIKVEGSGVAKGNEQSNT